MDRMRPHNREDNEEETSYRQKARLADGRADQGKRGRAKAAGDAYRQTARHRPRNSSTNRKAERSRRQDRRYEGLIDHLLADAEKPCDRKGFEAFKKYYCQGLSQSWTYELLAVQEGRKTLEEIRAATRQRVAKHRAAKRECNGIDSVTADEDPAASVAEPPAIRLNGGQVIDVEKLSPAAQAQLAEMLPAATTDTSADADDDDHYTGLRYLFEEVIGSFGAGMEGFDAISDEPAKMFCGLELSDDLCHFDSRLTTGAVRAHVQAARRSHHRSGYHTATARS